jgi:hypothetical protein
LAHIGRWKIIPGRFDVHHHPPGVGVFDWVHPHHFRATQPGQIWQGANRGRGDPKKRHKLTQRRPKVLVGGVPQCPTAAEIPHHATQVIAREHALGIPRPALVLEVLQHRVVQRPVGAAGGDRLAQKPRGRFDAHGVPGHQQHPLALGLQVLDVLEALDLTEFGLGWPIGRPRHGHLADGFGQVSKVGITKL